MANYIRGQRGDSHTSRRNRQNDFHTPGYSERNQGNWNEERYEDAGRYDSGNWNDGNWNEERGSRKNRYNEYPKESPYRGGSFRGGSYEGGYSNPDYRRGSDRPYGNSGNYSNYGNQDNYGSSGYQGYGPGSHYSSDYDRYKEGEQDSRDRSNEGSLSSWFQDDNNRRGGNWGNSQYDQNTGGQFRGKGPKGYQRTDERIQENINDKLSDDPDLDASEIEVSVSKGEVTLSGTVNGRTDKRRAEEIAETVSGVTNVENRIRLQQQGSENTGERNTGNGSSKASYSTATERKKQLTDN